MNLDNQGLTRDERQLRSLLFGDLKRSNLTRPVTEIEEKAYFEVITRFVETYHRELEDVLDGQSNFPLLEGLELSLILSTDNNPLNLRVNF